VDYFVRELLPFLYGAGCSSGIGVETARALHATGAHLFLTVRDMKKVRPYLVCKTLIILVVTILWGIAFIRSKS
jgi:hypothetical protein